MGGSWRRGGLFRWVDALKGGNICVKEPPPYVPNGEGLLRTGEEVLY